MFSFLPVGKAIASLKAKLSARESRATVLDTARCARERLQREERARVQELNDAQQIELWRQGNPHARTPWNGPTMLRIKSTEVETSRGARVPIGHAIRALRAVRKVVESGQEFVCNGHTLHVGHYSIDRIEANGTLHAGCHTITFEEIERVAPALEALSTEAFTDTTAEQTEVCNA